MPSPYTYDCFVATFSSPIHAFPVGCMQNHLQHHSSSHRNLQTLLDLPLPLAIFHKQSDMDSHELIYPLNHYRKT